MQQMDIEIDPPSQNDGLTLPSLPSNNSQSSLLKGKGENCPRDHKVPCSRGPLVIIVGQLTVSVHRLSRGNNLGLRGGPADHTLFLLAAIPR